MAKFYQDHDRITTLVFMVEGGAVFMALKGDRKDPWEFVDIPAADVEEMYRPIKYSKSNHPFMEH